MNDMASTIVPRTDQLNADSLLTGPITVTITKVTIRPGTEQPISVFYDGDDGKPWKCCKSMARILVGAWGADASKYIGRSVTLYSDPNVTWGGMKVGGVRISHMSDIPEAMTMALTVTKGNRKPFTVRPLKASAPPVNAASPAADPSRSQAGADSQRHGDALRSATTMDELVATWNAIPKVERAPFRPIRAEMEAKFAAPPNDFVADMEAAERGQA